MLLDRLAPEAALRRSDDRFLPAPQPKVFAAIQQVCPAELAGYAFAGWLTPFASERPLYAQMLGAGYSVLATVPLREVVIGRVGPLHRPFAPEPRVRDKQAFAAFAEPRSHKLLLGFALQPEEREGVKGTRVTAGLRVWDAARDDASGALRAIWPVAGPLSGAASRAFLDALARRVGA